MTTPPKNLSTLGKKAFKAVIEFCKEHELENPDESCFYTPKHWNERGEAYGTKSELILVHDGGPLAPLCNLDYGSYDMFDAFQSHMSKHGVYVEGCTCWYSAVYSID